MADLARESAASGLSVREVERRVKSARPVGSAPSAGGSAGKGTAAQPASGGSTAEVRRIEELLRKRLQTQVQIAASGRDRGELRIAFTSNEDLERLLELIGVSLE
jgi:ParB family chromosome partitioning protein